MTQPSIEVFGISIGEPVTFITDVLIAVVCFYAYFCLHQRKHAGQVQFFFKYYFLLLGLATLLSGLFGHAFLHIFGPGWKVLGWIVSIFSVAAFESMSVAHANKLLAPRIKKTLSAFDSDLNTFKLYLIFSTFHFHLNNKQ